MDNPKPLSGGPASPRSAPGVQDGIRGPVMLKWVRWLLDEHDELVRLEQERAKG